MRHIDDDEGGTCSLDARVPDGLAVGEEPDKVLPRQNGILVLVQLKAEAAHEVPHKQVETLEVRRLRADDLKHALQLPKVKQSQQLRS